MCQADADPVPQHGLLSSRRDRQNANFARFGASPFNLMNAPMQQPQELVLITGCGSGIGQALARAFHRSGQRVCATARRLDTLAPLAAEGMLVRALDVTDAQGTADLLASLKAEGFGVGTLVNNAGYGAMGPMLDVPQSEWQRQFEVNLFAPIALVRAVMPGMVERGRGLWSTSAASRAC